MKRVSLILMIWLFTPVLSASVIDGPGLSLFGFNGERQIGHVKSDPLMLNIMVDNTGAAIAISANKSNKKIVNQYSKTDAYNSLTPSELNAFNKRYGPREVPVVVLGSDQVSLESLINIQVRSAKGGVLDLRIRPLAANPSAPEPIEVTAHEAHLYQFVIEPDQLKGLPDGIYFLAAGIDTRDQQAMWQGWTFSKTLIVKLAAKADVKNWRKSEQRAQLISTYLIDDHQFSKAEAQAREWIANHPNSVDAWAQLGEALFGLKEYQESLDSFLTAVNKFEAKLGKTPAELPMELIERIHTIEQLSGLRPPLNPDDPVPDENTPRPDNL